MYCLHRAIRSQVAVVMSDIASRISERLQALSQPNKALLVRRFFKIAPGEYAENDDFLGVPVPEVRALAKGFLSTAPADLLPLLKSRWHEERMCCLVIWVAQSRQAEHPEARQTLFELYISHLPHINNWDLVDISAADLCGRFLLETHNPAPLAKLLQSRSLWERRIAIVSTWAWIKSGDISLTLRFAESLLKDAEDLIHKATGWMLREAGKVDESGVMTFIEKHGSRMPRTMLRYAIERFDAKTRKAILLKTRTAGIVRPPPPF